MEPHISEEHPESGRLKDNPEFQELAELMKSIPAERRADAFTVAESPLKIFDPHGIKSQQTISQTRRQAIESSGRIVHEIGQASGVNHAVILRFLSGERSQRLDTADKLAEALGVSTAIAKQTKHGNAQNSAPSAQGKSIPSTKNMKPKESRNL